MAVQRNADPSPLAQATENFDIEEVRSLLEAGEDPNQSCWGWPLLHHSIDVEADASAQRGGPHIPPDGEMVELFLLAGADPNQLDSRGRTALDVASDLCRHDRAVHLLTDYGGKKAGDLD